MTGTKSLIINQQRKILKNKWNFFHPKACRYKKSHYLCTRNQEITDTQIRIDSLAQQVEHNTFNVGVLGSSPRRITERQVKTRLKEDNSYNIKVLQEFFLCIMSVTKDTKKSRKDILLWPTRDQYNLRKNRSWNVPIWLTSVHICPGCKYLIYNQ